MTPEAFSRYFKRATGRNVSVFLNELRVDHAGRLLRETPRRVADIAAEAGFPALSNFNRKGKYRGGRKRKGNDRALPHFAGKQKALLVVQFTGIKPSTHGP